MNPAAAPPSAQALRFGGFCLLPGRRELRFGEAPVAIGHRAFDLLLALATRPGQLVGKDTLMAEVWAGTVVEDNNLAAQASALRKVLAADPALAGCLQAVPARGYRFTAEVVADAAGTPSPAADPQALSLVVMPFTALGAGDQAHVAEGLSHTVATDLSRIAGLDVVASASAACLPAGPFDARQVSRALGVRYLLAGSVQRHGPRLRVNAQLVDGPSGRQLWSDRFDGDDGDLFALQDRITGRIANAIGREVFVAAARDGEARPVASSAFDLLMRGIAADNRPQSLPALREQAAWFAQAVARDPCLAEAHARLARALLLQVTQAHAPTAADEDTLARGVAAAEAAVALGPANARAHCAMGLVHVLRGDFPRAVGANEAAIALDRNFALAHNNLGNAQVHLAEGAAGLQAADTALRLDPRGPQRGAFCTTRGFALLLLDRPQEAVAAFEQARTANPQLPRAAAGLAIAHVRRGDAAAARSVAAELRTLAPHYRLSQTIDACRPGSSDGYRRFHDEVLRPGAEAAGLPP
ncbi:winged helix-turn-helix domain-containing protein [Aquabacterium sp. J223]|uniref:winged helix-turn-helix domain-containing protein n=1 Tax=Aquabacterium sp. J223 TaxID=2898431 RepID=UPI0021AD7F62|nr:winged helix-turn-helix domain-containing protein [Aquabacterium sp. J223]UUX96319.1 winged helix-turn-helix domain-containing protein [Aquabacterium sp. J223]